MASTESKPAIKKVGATLLDNWVEERAVADQLISEHANIQKLSKAGHKDILVNQKKPLDYKTTNFDCYDAICRGDPSPNSLGKRRSKLQEELFKIASMEPEIQKEDIESHWLTTTKSVYTAANFKLKELGSEKPEKGKLESLADPVTFWTDFAAKGSGTATCSLDSKQVHAKYHPEVANVIGYKAGQLHQHEASLAPIRFCKNAGFSTPIGQ